MPATATLPEIAAEFLSRPLIAQIVTLNPSGSPQLTYVWFERQDNQLVVSTRRDRVKARNLAQDPRVSIGIIDPEDPWRWITVNGRAELSGEDAHALIERLALKYMGPERGAAYAERTKAEPRVVIRITPERIRSAGFDGGR